MGLFKKRETPSQNIAYMALMAGLNIIFVLLSFFIPFLLFLLVFILPLSSAVVAIYCKKKYYPIYAIVTLGLCLIVTITNIADTLFFVFPSLITGFIFGLLYEKDVPSIVIIAATTIIQVLLTYPGLALANYIIFPGQEDIFVTLSKVFGINDTALVPYVKHMVIAIISLIQQTICFIVMNEEIGKIYEPKKISNDLNLIIMNSISGLMLVFIILSIFLFKEFVYAFTIGSALISIFNICILVSKKNRWINVILVSSFIIVLFLLGALYTVTPSPLQFVYINIYFLITTIIVFINNYLLNDKKNR